MHWMSCYYVFGLPNVMLPYFDSRILTRFPLGARVKIHSQRGYIIVCKHFFFLHRHFFCCCCCCCCYRCRPCAYPLYRRMSNTQSRMEGLAADRRGLSFVWVWGPQRIHHRHRLVLISMTSIEVSVHPTQENPSSWFRRFRLVVAEFFVLLYRRTTIQCAEHWSLSSTF